MWSRLDDRGKKLVAILGTIVCLTAFYWLVLNNQISTYQARGQELEEQQRKFTQARVKVAGLEKQRQRLAEASERLDELLLHFKTEYQDGSIMVLLGLNALDNNVLISQVKPGEVVDKEHYIEIPAEIEFWGPYQGILAMINMLERMDNLVHLKTLNINHKEAPGGATAEILLVARINVVFYTDLDTGKPLIDELAKIYDWRQGRGTAAFAYPGLVSAYKDIPVGGESTLVPKPPEMPDELLPTDSEYLWFKDKLMQDILDLEKDGQSLEDTNETLDLPDETLES